jgi:hypothetical protein
MIFHQKYIHELFRKHLGPFADAIEAKSPELYSGIVNAICAAEEDARDFLDWFWTDDCPYVFRGPNKWQDKAVKEAIITTAQLHSLFISQKLEKAKNNQGSQT